MSGPSENGAEKNHRSTTGQLPLAIVGMACRLPGADGLDEFWRLLIEGRDAVVDLPPERLDRALYFDADRGRIGRTYTTRGGLIDDRPLRPEICPFSESELADHDPCHLILCETAAAAWRHAGRRPDEPCREITGVYVGHSGGSPLGGELGLATLAEESVDFLRDVSAAAELPRDLLDEAIAEAVDELRRGRPRRRANGGPEVEANMAAGLVARKLGLRGPRMAIDAACASSLMALSAGAHALQQGRIDAAVIAGASFHKSDSLILFSQAQSCSAEASRPFDARADGLVGSEGYVAIVLKTLPRALADGDTIHAVVRGVGVASDGRGRNLWAPRPEGQIEAIRRAYGADLDPRQVQFIEAHATSTQVGDATELQALADFFGPIARPSSIPIGSVKSNIGHTLETAGLAGLLKTVLALQHRMVPPTIHLESLNPSVDWNELPFFVPTRPIAWPEPPAGQPRRGAVNAFGIGGLNVHVVLEEFCESARRTLVRSLRPPATCDEPIAIVGRGLVVPGAGSVAEFARLRSEGRSAIGDPPNGRWRRRGGDAARSKGERPIGVEDGPPRAWRTPTCRGGYLRDYAYDWRRHRIPPKQIAQANPLQFLLLDAARQALDETSRFDRRRTAVVVGSVFGGEFGNQLMVGLRAPELRRALDAAFRRRGVDGQRLDTLLDQYEQRLFAARPALLDETGSFTSSTLASRISKTLDLMGGAMALDAGDASSLSAVSVACNLLRSGDCSLVLCAAADRALDLTAYESLDLHGRLRRDDSRQTDDRRRPDCHLPGEGAVLLALKRWSDARRDGERVLGVLRDPTPLAASRLADVGEFAAEGAHDQEEPYTSQDIEVLGVEPLASCIGHLRAAHGLVALIDATLQLESTDKPRDRRFVVEHRRDDGQALRVMIESEEAACEAKTASATAVSAPAARAAEATQAAALDVRRVLPTAGDRGESTDGARIVRLHGATADEFERRIATALQRAEVTWSDADERAARSSPLVGSSFPPSAAWRLAIVADGVESLRSKLQSATAGWRRAESCAALDQQAIFVRRRPDRAPRTAFLFPGQGSQYVGMGRGLIEASPAARNVWQEANRWLEESGRPTFDQMAWTSSDRSLSNDSVSQTLGVDVWTTQAAMLVADLMYHAALVERGVRPDLLAGHSYGEYPALVAAGSWTLEQALRATAARTEAIRRCQGAAGGAMLAIAADAGCVAQWLRRVADRSRRDDELFISHENAPDLTVVAGRSHAVAELHATLTAAGLHAVMLPVPCPFHTPLMHGSQEPLRRALQTERLLPPATPLLSHVTNRFVAEPDEIRENLVRQMVAPVRYTALVGRLVDDQVDLLVEVGPQQVLTGLHRRILASRSSAEPSEFGEPARTCREPAVIAADHPRRSSREQLLCVQAMYECLSPSPLATTPASAISRRGCEVIRRTAFPGRPRYKTRRLWDALERASYINSQPRCDAAPSIAPDGLAVGPPVVQFDATQRRRERMRRQAAARSDEQIGDQLRERLFSPVAPPDAPSDTSTDAPAVPTSTAPKPAASQSAAPIEQIDARQVGDRHDRPTSLRRDRQALERLLIDLVIERTGFPGEMIELEMDMEADLGFSSITKAQLFGDLREFFAFPAKGQWSLGQFRTLRQVLELLVSIEPTDSAGLARSTAGNVAASLDHHASDEFDDATEVADATEVELPTDLDTPANVEASAAFVGPAVSSPLDAASFQDGLRVGRLHAGKIQRLLRDLVDRIAIDDQAIASNAAALRTLWTDAAAATDSESTAGASGRKDAAGVGGGSETRIDTAVESWAPASRFSLDVLRGVADGACLPLANLLALRPHTTNAEMPESPRVASRYVLRMATAPQRRGAPTRPEFHGASLIVGDNAVADALHARLIADGHRAYRLPSPDNRQEAIAALQRLWRHEPLPHLFLVTPRDADAVTTWRDTDWRIRRARGVDVPFRLCQCWMRLVGESRLLNDASLVGLTSLGGDFGFSGQVAAVESGALTGLLKSIAIESWVNGYRSLPVKLIDSPVDEPPDALVEATMRELAVSSYDVEIGWSRGVRRVVRACREDADAILRRRAESVERLRPAPQSGNVWVCSGGGRGITAFVAKTLATRYGLKLHLFGTAPAPTTSPRWRAMAADRPLELKLEVLQQARDTQRNPIQAWQEVEKALEIERTLADLSALGIAATYHTCDVADRAALVELLDAIRRQDGPIHGVLHGAGVGQDARFDQKDPEKVEQCLRAKVDGARRLMELTRDDPLRHFVAFGSISGRFGANGHTDYSLANDMLAKQIDWYRRQRPDVAATLFHWHAWGDVGMAVRPETRLALEMIDMQFMPATEGVSHLIAELEAGAPESEILVTDDLYHRRFYPTESLLAAVGAAEGAAEGAASQRPLPLIDGARRLPHDSPHDDVAERSCTYTLSLDPTVEPFLIEHRLDDRPLLPLVVGLELLCEAAWRTVDSPRSGNAASPTCIVIRDVQAVDGLRFFTDRPREMSVRVRTGDQPSHTCELTADVLARDGRRLEADRLHLRGQVAFNDLSGRSSHGKFATGGDRRAPNVASAEWSEVDYAPRGARFYLGPPLRCLRKLFCGDDFVWGRIVAPALVELTGPRRGARGWMLPSAAMDACLVAVGTLAWRRIAPGPALPVGLGELVVDRLPSPGESCLVEARIRSVEGRFATFDFSLFGCDGQTILAARDYRIAWLGEEP